MKIDIYIHTRNRFIAVPHKQDIPPSWVGARFFNTIDLQPSDVRIGLPDAAQVLASIKLEGYAVLRGVRWGLGGV